MVETSRETSQQKAQVTFPPFCSQKKSFLSGKNEDKESMALELKELSGKGLTSADIQAVLNQEIMILKEIVFMRYNIKNTIGAACFFFFHHPLLPNRLAKVDQRIEKNLEIHEAYFAVEFLFLIDTRIHSALATTM